MALGIDTAAHRAALDTGGRTLAVMGTGIRLRYPAQNRDLADRVEAGGALISQFWPDQPPAGFRFPMRNIVTSGMSLGTVVIEASSTSGAKSQARHALEHGKRVFLVRPLVLRERWAQEYVEKRGAIAIESVDEILAELVSMSRASEAKQLTLG
jgi:DNA processing protein